MASETGRGAQVRLDDTARQLARGGAGGRLIDNVRAKAAGEAAGTLPSGNTPDGSLGDGTAADDEVLLPGGAAGSAGGGGQLAVSAIAATGTRDATTYLRGDGTWSTPAGGSAGTLAITGGGTGATTAAGARTALGLGTAATTDATAYATAAGLAAVTHPAASATPVNIGDLVFEATSNTSLTLRFKGLDGVVRSVALALAAVGGIAAISGAAAVTISGPVLAASGSAAGGGATYGGTLAITAAPTGYRIFQRTTATGSTFSKGSGPVSLTINPTATVTTLEYRLRDFDSTGTTLQDWTTCGTNVAAGSQTLALTLAAHAKWYLLDLRANGAAGSIVSTSARFGVGDLWLHGGQSQQVNNIRSVGQFQTNQTATDLGITPNGLGSVYVYATDANNGTTTPAWGPLVPAGGALTSNSPYLAEFINRMVTAAGVLTGVAGAAVDSTAIASWDQTSDANMVQLLAVISAIGGRAAGYSWFQYGTDAANGTSGTAYKAGLDAHWAVIKANTTFPFGTKIDLVPMGARTGADIDTGTEDQNQVIRQAQLQWIAANADAQVAYTWPDMANDSGTLIHQTGAGCVLMAERYALTCQAHLGLRSGTAIGPTITSATRASGSAAVVLQVQLNGGTSLAPRGAGAVDGFEVFTAGTTTNWPISSVSIGTASAGVVPVTLTLASVPGNAVALDVHAPYGKDASAAAYDNLLYDNTTVAGSTLGLPLADNSLTVSAAAPGGATATFPTLGGKVVFRASALASANLTLSGSNITAIKDQSGSGYDMAFAGSTNATYVSTGGANNQPYIDFGTTGPRDYSTTAAGLRSSITGSDAPFHIFSVVWGAAGGADSSAVIAFENTTTGGFQDHITQYFNNTGTNTLGHMIRGDDNNGTPSAQAQTDNFAQTTWQLLEGKYASGTVSAYVNGAQAGSTSPSATTGTGALVGVSVVRIGARTSSGTKARFLSGRLAEVIVCNAVLTGTERTALLSWISSTYGISAV
jgi:hypothetical protein